VPQWKPPDDWSYALLLGLFLGDGCLSKMPRTWTMRISMDAAYPELVEQAVTATQLVALDARLTTRKAVGVRWTQSNPRNISVSHRDSVALLDEFVGLKA
jgi:hypothetical protein